MEKAKKHMDKAKKQVDKAMANTTDDLRSEVKKSVALLKELRDEVRAKLALASADAKEEWARIDGDLTKIELAAQNATHESKKALADAGERVRQFAKRI